MAKAHKKGEFWREAALHYVEANKLEATNEMKDQAIIKIIDEAIGTQIYQCDVCGKYVTEHDTYCWYCGDDVSVDETGGFDRIAAKEIEKDLDTDPEPEPEPEVEDKRIKVVDKTEKESTPKKEKAKKETKPKKEKAKKETTPEESEPEESALVANEESDEMVTVTLADRIKRIRTLELMTGENAWQIGKELYTLNASQQYTEMGFNTFEKFCEDVLGYSRFSAYRFIQISEFFTAEQASKVGIFKLTQLVSAPEEIRTQLLNAAMTEHDGGEGLTREQLAEKIKEAKADAGVKTTERKTSKPKKSPFKPFLGSAFDGKYQDDEKTWAFIPMDDFVGLEIRILKSKIKVEIIENALQE